jgi:hypothetical protein
MNSLVLLRAYQHRSGGALGNEVDTYIQLATRAPDGAGKIWLFKRQWWNGLSRSESETPRLSHLTAGGTFFSAEPHRLKFRGSTPPKCAFREGSPRRLGVSPVTLVTFRDSFPNSTSLHIQIPIHSKVSTGYATHGTTASLHTLSMPRPQRTRVPSQKAQENQLNNQLETEVASQKASRVASSTPKLRSRNQTKAQPTKSRKKKKQAKAAESTTGAPSKPIPKIPSILGQSKSARQLRQNPRTALLPFLVRENASWDKKYELPFAEKGPNNDDGMVPSLSTLFEEQEDSSISNPYTDGTLPEPIPNPEPISQKEVEAVGYYSHPEFTPIERNLHEAQCNLPKNLTDPFEIFQLFFPKKLIPLDGHADLFSAIGHRLHNTGGPPKSAPREAPLNG